MPWLRRRRSERLPAATAGQAEASKALGKAEESLEDAQDAGREIMAAVRRLKRLGDDNDFAARISRAMGGSP
jgi:hypothetical protein